MNAVEKILEQLNAVAADNGYTVHRYQTNHGSHAVSITYAAHPVDEPRPARSDACERFLANLSQREGTTERCEAYRLLSRAAARLA